MPDPVTNSAPPAPGASLAFKAAGAAFIAALGLFVAICLGVSMPQKLNNGWRAALPTQGMNEAEAAGALLRAKYQHEGAVRPALVRAGFASPADMPTQSLRPPALSQSITEALWTMRVFPETHDAFFAMLTDTGLPAGERLTRLYQVGELLNSAATVIAANGKNSGNRPDRRYGTKAAARPQAGHWFRFYTQDPKLSPQNAEGTPAAEDQAVRANYAEKLAFARNILPLIFADVSADVQARFIATQADGTAPDAAWDGMPRNAYMQRLDMAVRNAVSTLWRERATPNFRDKTREIITIPNAPLADRYRAIPLIAAKPDLLAPEYLTLSRYKNSLNTLDARLETAPGFHAYRFNEGNKLCLAARAMLETHGRFSLEGHDGPGVTATAVEATGGLYLLADMAAALKDAPAYDLSRAYPVFNDPPFRYLANQPLVLPLNPNDPADKALLDWYASDGWREGRTLLFSAAVPPALAARHWGSLLVAWWPDTADGDESVPVLLHPQSGHFLHAVLPLLKGEALARFFGPVTAMWYGRQTVDANGWVDELHTAGPGEATLPAPPRKPVRSPLLDRMRGIAPDAPAAPSKAESAVVFGQRLAKAASDSFRHKYRIELAKRLDASAHDASMRPIEVYDFVDNAVSSLRAWGFATDASLVSATELFWQYHNDDKTQTAIREGLSDTSLRPYDRLRKVRRALGRPGQKGR